MRQLLFESLPVKRFETFIDRDGDRLRIPEGLQTIPCTHGIHRFPGKFIPNLPRYLFRSVLKCRQDKKVLDPFCGSGTTAIEAALEGRSFVAIDIDPLAVLISKAKTFPLSEEELVFVDRYWAGHDYRLAPSEFVPNVPNLRHWFSQKAIEELSSIKASCMKLSGQAKIFSLIVFSSILRRVSNADDQTQKTYVSHTRVKTPPPVRSLFPVFLQRAIAGMREYNNLLPAPPNGNIYKADAREEIPKFDDVITSPPYIDSIDYVYNQMLEYFWLMPELGIDSYEQLRRLRKKPMGFKTEAGDPPDFFRKKVLTSLDRVCSSIGEISFKEASSVRSFFFDFRMHLERVRRSQSQGGYYICIVGNSVIRSVLVPTVDILVKIFENCGYILRDKLQYEIRRHYMKFPRKNNSGKIIEDYVLVFQLT